MKYNVILSLYKWTRDLKRRSSIFLNMCITPLEPDIQWYTSHLTQKTSNYDSIFYFNLYIFFKYKIILLFKNKNHLL